ITKLRNELIGQQAILTTVDLEMGKVKLYKDSDPDKIKFRESSLLDFLPPLGTITNISTIDSHVQYHEHTGNKEFEKCRIKAKIKWYNNESNRFSEAEVPLVALKEVEEIPTIDPYVFNKIYYIEKEIAIEGNQIKVRKIPVKVIDLVFKHYQYHYLVRNLFNHNLMLLDRDVIPKELETRPDFNFEDPGTLDLTVADHRGKTFAKNPGTWF